MNKIKFALLGTAAIAAVSVSAQASTASDIADLKAQINALSAQVAANQAQTSIPAGFQLVTISTQPTIAVPGLSSRDARDLNTTATTMAILPTADAPASTVVQWTGFVRAAFVYKNGRDTPGVGVPPGPTTLNDFFDIKARGQINVVGKTDTAIGEIGAQMSVRGSWEATGGFNGGNAKAEISNAWGWWKMTPDLTLAGGFNGSLSSIGYGYDGSCNCYYTDNASAGTSLNGDVAQIRLTYASGPLSAAIAVEDGHNVNIPGTNTSVVAVAAKVGYSGDLFSAAISGGYEPSYPFVAGPPPNAGGPEAKYIVAIGAKIGLGDIGFISAEADAGSGHLVGDNFYGASILGSLNLSDQAHFEAAYNHVRFKDGTAAAYNEDAVLAGLYYDPVSQLTIGLEAEWIRDDRFVQSSYSADIVTVFRF